MRLLRARPLTVCGSLRRLVDQVEERKLTLVCSNADEASPTMRSGGVHVLLIVTPVLTPATDPVATRAAMNSATDSATDSATEADEEAEGA